MGEISLISTIQIIGLNPYIFVPKDQAELVKPSWRKPIPVLVRVNEKPDDSWHINMVPDGKGNFYLYLHAYVRKASNTKVGDQVKVQIVLDENYRNGPLHEMPEWFSDALNLNQTAQSNWNKLPPSRKKEILRYFANLRSEEAISRNLSSAINVLTGNNAEYMGRKWDGGS